MRNRNLPSDKNRSTLIIAIALMLIAGWQWYSKRRGIKNFDLNRDAQITYSKHAKCRMKCRHIDKSEVQEVLKKGKINDRKSKPQKGTLALEARTHDDQDVRLVIAKKNKNKVHVVTVIDLDTEWQCDCD